MKKLAGEYIVYFRSSFKQQLRACGLKILPNGQGLVRSVTLSHDNLEIQLLNHQNIAIINNTYPVGTSSFCYIVQPKDVQMNILSGYLAGVGRNNMPKGSGVFMIRQDDAFGKSYKDIILPDSAEEQELVTKYGEHFQEVF